MCPLDASTKRQPQEDRQAALKDFKGEVSWPAWAEVEEEGAEDGVWIDPGQGVERGGDGQLHAKLVEIGQPDLIEIKGFLCGSSKASTPQENVPWHTEVVRFVS